MKTWLWGALAWALLATGAPAQETWGTVTLMRGGPVVIRGSARLQAVEGARLSVGDIVETGPQGLLVIESAAARVGLGPGTSAMAIAPTVPVADAGLALYLQRGAIKYAANATGAAGSVHVTGPMLNVQLRDGAAVILTGPSDAALFLETGEAGVFEPLAGMNETLLIRVRAREYYTRRAGAQGVVLPRFSPEFLSAIPRVFMDNLPNRLARYRDASATMPAGAEVGSVELSHWSDALPALRKSLSARTSAAAPSKVALRTDPEAGRSPADAGARPRQP